MDESAVETKFWDLCERAHRFDEENLDLPQLEPYLQDVLNFVKENQASEKLFKKWFVEMAEEKRRFSNWILLYCMRELRYPEVQYAVNKRFNDLGGPTSVPRLMNYVSAVNWGYDDAPWEDAIFFRYFWQREHPGEPWPCEKRT